MADSKKNISSAKIQQRLRAFLDTSSDIVYQMSPDWSEMRRLKDEESNVDMLEPTRTWLHEYIHPDDQQHVREKIQESIRTKSPFEMEHRVIRTDGSPGWVFSRAVPVLDEDGEIIEWFGVATDITERKRHEEKLRAGKLQQQFLVQMNDALSSLTDPVEVQETAMRLLGIHMGGGSAGRSIT